MFFDKHGYITPYQIIEIPLTEFEEIFILNREEKSHRNKLFNDYLRFVKDVQNIIGTNFYQLINGSFTTLKLKPDDIDFVTFVDYKILENNEMAITKLGEIGKEEYGLDCFLLLTFLPDTLISDIHS